MSGLSSVRPARFFRHALAALLLAGTVTFAGAGVAQAESVRQVTDRYLFQLSLAEFGQVRASTPRPAELDWSSDGCSAAPDNPFGFQFTPACHRHDFGYRNYKRQQRFNADTRLRLDDRFHADLKQICAGNRICLGTAWTYYQAVRKFGGN
ncbi:phospholipase A2-like protein [Tamaricihabitans halophyticus]|uniref:Phospholipase A2-like protein n=1 Tax=Tamaricihabitans halophyticus TaxID=1262583 RepID=A0A4R2PYK2_9PSEU|nr:phospholipase [Tamaricihabitans halophyticus]TCP41109.1 phospholipase A2-like protein [Tamaricihabitans halophyticus]